MTLNDLIEWLRGSTNFLPWLALATPVVLFGWTFSPASRTSRKFGWVASTLVAAGFVAMPVALGFLIYMGGRGTDLGEVSLVGILSPFWFGLGNVWAATRAQPFVQLKTYPLLRRVWATLLSALLLMLALFILSRTYMLIFTGIIGFVILAIVIWTLFQKLVGRAVEPAPEGGDGDLLDDVAAESHRRVGRFAQRLAAPPDEKKR